MNIAEILKQQAQHHPETVALIDTHRGRERCTTFAELELASAQAASLLKRHGLKAGDAVLVFVPLSLELYIALIAIFRLGLVATFLDPSAGRAHIERCCQLHRPKGFIGTAKSHLLRLVSPALRRIEHKFVVGFPVPGAVPWRRIAHAPPDHVITERQESDAALITFTSGSSGQPKAAVRSHGFLIAQHRALESSLALKQGQLDLSTLPIFVLANLASGVTSLIPNTDLRRPGSIDAATVMEQINRHKPDRSAASPAFYECLSRYCNESGDSLSTFEQIYTGGAPVFPRLLAKLQQLSPQGEIVAVYGSTEAEPIAHIAYANISEPDLKAMMSGKGLLTGWPDDSIKLRIMKMQWGKPRGPYSEAEFAQQLVVPGEVGEIVVTGGHVLKGYLNGHGDEETKFDVAGERWHRTGDAGYLDPHGRLWLMGRCSALIQDAKGSLYPFAVESAAIHFPGVRYAALMEHQGRRMLLIEEAITGECDVTGLGDALHWALLDKIRPIPKIPLDRRHNAKIDYPALRKQLSRHGSREA